MFCGSRGRGFAVIVAHIAGEPADMYPIMALAKKHGLYVIEDCAQAHGAKYKGRLVGTIGDIAAFSTMFGKHHCTGGQGGVVYTRNETLHWQARRFADRGKPFNIDATSNVVAGLNCNLNDLSAVIGSAQIKKLPTMIAMRRKIGAAIKEGLADCKAVSMGWQCSDSEPAYWFIRLKLDRSKIVVGKEEFCKALEAEGISNITPSYRHIPCEAEWFKNKAVFGNSGFPWNCSDYKGNRNPQIRIDNALQAIDEHFNFFINENYGQKEIDDIIFAIKKLEKAYLR